MKYVLNKWYKEGPTRENENSFPVATPNSSSYDWFGGFSAVNDTSVDRLQGITLYLYYKSYYGEDTQGNHPSEFLVYIDELVPSDYDNFDILKAKGYFDYWDDMYALICGFVMKLGFELAGDYYYLTRNNDLTFDEFEDIYNSFMESLLEYMNENKY